MKEQVGRHTVYRTSQQHSASSQHVAHTTRTTSQRTGESSDEGTPVASPHRAGFTAGLHPECTPSTSSEQSTRSPVSSRMTQHPASVAIDKAETLDDEDDDALYTTRSANSSRRYQMPVTQEPRTIVRYHHQPIPPRSSRTTYTQERPPIQPQRSTTTQQAHPQPTQVFPRRQPHWLVYVGVTMLVVIVLYIGGSLFLKWWHVKQNDLTYGRPRTFQCDAHVGHNDAHTPSHFVALNLNKQVEIIEFPGGDATKARVYVGPTLIGEGEELTPVTLTFQDVNGDGKLDMIVHIGSSSIIFINDNGAFRPVKPTDHITL